MNHIESQINRLQKNAEPILIEMAVRMLPLVQSEMVSLAPQKVNPYRKTPVLNHEVDEWCTVGIIKKSVENGKTYFSLPVKKHLQLIEQFENPNIWTKALNDVTAGSLFSDKSYSGFPLWVLIEMVHFLQGKPYLQEPQEIEDHRKDFSNGEYFSIQKLLVCAMCSDKWVPFMRKLTQQVPLNLYHDAVFCELQYLRKPVPFIRNCYFLSDPGFKYQPHTAFIWTQESTLALMMGDISLARSLVREDALMAQLPMAILKMYEGKHAEAYALFEQIISPTDIGRAIISLTSVYPFYYLICLFNVWSELPEKKRKQIEKELNTSREDAIHSGRPWAALIISKIVDAVEFKKGQIDSIALQRMTALDALLTSIVMRFYYGYEGHSNIMLMQAEMEVHKSPYALLATELNHSMVDRRTEHERFCKEKDIKSPLQNGFTFLPKWEKILDALNAQVKPKKSKTAKSAKPEKLARVIYNMWVNSDNTEFSFTPRLQKSSDGINWTGGRNIALKSFGTQKEGLTELDLRISHEVKTYSYGWYGQTSYELSGKSVLQLLIDHPNVYLEDEPDTHVSIIGEDLQISVERSSKGFKIKTNLQDLKEFHQINVVRENHYTFKVIKISNEQISILQTLKEVKSFPNEAETKLTQFLSNLSTSTTVLSDMLQNSNANAQKVEADSILTIRMRQVGEGIQGDILARPFGNEGPSFQPAQGNEIVASVVNGQSMQTSRNLKDESLHLDAIRPLLAQHADEYSGQTTFYCDSAYSTLEILEALYPQTEHCRLEWPEGERWKVARLVEAKDMTLSVHSAQSWFEVEGELKVSEKKVLKIAELLALLHNGEGRFICVGENEYIALSDQLRRQLSQLEAMSTVQRRKVQVSQFSTSAIESLEEAGVQLEVDDTYQKFMKLLKESSEVSFRVPKGLQAELREYQKEGVAWMNRLASWGAGACLADDMGLGKTLQAITLMLYRKKCGPTLVVVPTSVTLNWRNEIERFAPQLNVLLLNTSLADRETLVKKASNGDVVIATYGLLVTEEELLCSRSWNMIVLDEAHTIKNKDTKMSKAAMQLKGEFRLLLTGTPLQNHLGELWNLFQFSNPGLLGSNAQFQEKYISPIEKSEDKERMRQLKRLVAPFILRRTKNEVLDELPEKSEITVKVQLSDEEMSVYENLRRQAVLALESGESSPMQTLAEITKLRQAACNVQLIDKKLKIESSKLTTLLNMVQNLISNDHRALIFSQFTSHLALVRKALDREGISYIYLDGSNTAREREQLVKEFQEGSVPLFLISLKAGGTGLNLTAADFVFHLDPWWNPAIEDQASDRTYRIGQTRPVTIYRIIAQQTIEEKILRLHATKKSLADSLLEGTNASHKLTKEEMLELLKG